MLTPDIAPNVSPLELTWTSIALLGTLTALFFLGFIWLSYTSVREWIDRGWARRWGPRHKFVLGFLLGMVLLLVVWIGFDALGVNAMFNPPPPTPDRAAASERGGWILAGLEASLLAVQGVLFWAWVTVGRPTLATDRGAPTLADLLEAQTDDGREMAHLIADSMQQPVATLDGFARDERLPLDARTAAVEALAALDRVMAGVRQLHRQIKQRGGAP